jgi:hypothetical protein
MAGESVVGALRVVLGMDIVQFEDGAKKAQSAAQGLASELQKTFGALIALESLKKIADGIANVVSSMDQMGKSAQKVGVTVEEFSALSYAANLADVQTSDLTSGMEKLGKNLAMVAGGAKGPTSDAVRAMGLSLRDSNGQLKDTRSLLLDVADKFSSYRDGAAKAALATALFGKIGPELVVFLNEGRKAIEDAGNEAKLFGVVVGRDAAQAAQELNDNLKRLSAQFQGVLIQSISNVIGEWVAFSDAMVRLGGDAKTTQASIDAITGILKYFTAVLEFAVFDVTELVKTIGLLIDVGAALKNGEFGKIPDLLTQYKDTSLAAASATYEHIKAVMGMAPAIEKANLGLGDWVSGWAAYVKSTQQVDAPLIATKGGIDKFIESTQKSISGLQAQVGTFGDLAGSTAAAKIILEGYVVAQEENVTLTAAQEARINSLANAVGHLHLQLEGMKLQQDALSGWDQLTLKIDAAHEALASVHASQSAFFATDVRLTGEYANQVSGYFSTIEGGFAAAAQQQHEFAGIAKAAAYAQALFSTYSAAAKALELFGPTPLGFGAAALAVAAGLGYVAKISATKFASGGSFTVGGGLSHVDNQLVTLALSSGEMVDVRRPGQGGSGGGYSEISLSGVGPKDLFTGTMLRDLVETLNRGHRDGYRLKLGER